MSIDIGQFKLHEIRDAAYRLDGGSLFDMVPRKLWEKKDTQREFLQVDRHRFNLDEELARAGTDREEITDVVLSHLHFFHSGGIVWENNQCCLELVFPKATFHVQRRQFRWAHYPIERDAKSFHRDDFVLLEQYGHLHFIEGESELCEGVQIHVSEGHTVGMQLVRVQAEGIEVIYYSDLIPTISHLKPNYQMASDFYPLTALEEKKMLQAEAVESGAYLYFSHDPAIVACRVRESGGAVVAGAVAAFRREKRKTCPSQ